MLSPAGKHLQLFETYRFDNLDTDESHFLGGWSYVWASLGGPVYILSKGFVVPALLMVPITAVLAGGAVIALVIIVGLIDHLMISVASMVAVPLVAFAIQGVIAIQLVRAAFIRRGWREGY
jgi:hypothetical protein